jgi:site-specific DNA-methyltransferase (adenine-specific)
MDAEIKPLVVHNPNKLPLAKIADLKPTQGSLKDLTKENYAKLKASVDKHGFIYPIAVWLEPETDNKWLLDGHQRKRFLDKEHPEAEIPIIEIPADNLQDAAEILLKITSQYGTITQEGVDAFIATYRLPEAEIYQAVQFDALPLLGQNEEEEPEEDETPEVDEKNPSVSKPGTIYQLGSHKLMCGSATELDDVNSLTGGVQVDLLHTDPPYNVDYTGKTKDALKIENDKKNDVDFRDFLADSFTNAAMSMKQCASFYIFHADSEGYAFRGACVDAGLQVRQCLTWVKNSMVMGRQDYQWQHEPILYGWKEGASHLWYSDRKQTTVLNFDRPSRSIEHPTMKPINICSYLICNNSKEGDIVLDLFGGSGSTLIACEQKNRICYMMELDPKYCDVIRKRYHKLTTGEDEGWEEATPAI